MKHTTKAGTRTISMALAMALLFAAVLYLPGPVSAWAADGEQESHTGEPGGAAGEPGQPQALGASGIQPMLGTVSGNTFTIDVSATGQLKAELDSTLVVHGLDVADVHKLVVTGPINQDDIWNAIYKPETTSHYLPNLTHLDLSGADYASATLGTILFAGNILLEWVALPRNITAIDNSTFFFCATLATVVLPSGLLTIGEHAFEFCYSLTYINLEDCAGLRTIGEYAFSETGLTRVDFDGMGCLEEIGYGAFMNCPSLETVTLPSGLLTIGDYAFIDCNNLTSINLEDCAGLRTIGKEAFEFTGLTRVELGGLDSLEGIGAGAFLGCSSLETVDLSGCVNLTGIGGSSFFDCPNLEEVDLRGCTNLASIGMKAFASSKLTRLDLTGPTGVVSVDGDTFDVTSGILVTVPSGLYGAYASDGNWDANVQQFGVRLFGGYQLTLAAGTGGAIVQDSSGLNHEDTIIPIEAQANPGYTFDRWESSNGGTFGNPSDSTTTFTMPGNDTTVTAHFTQNPEPKYALTIMAGTGGSITTGSSGQYQQGDSIQIVAQANPGYSFHRWESSNGGTFGNASHSSTTFTMPGNATTITAHFTKDGDPIPATYALTIVAGTGGSIATGSSGQYKQGDSIQIEAQANPGYTFHRWESTSGGTFGNASGSSTTFTMPGNATTVTAHFTKDGGNGNNGGGSTSTGSSSSSRNRDSSRTTPATKTRLPASAFSWDGQRTLTIDHEGITPLGLNGVQWNGVDTAAYSVYQGSVIVRFDADFIANQPTGEHTVRVEFLNHTGETTVTVGETGLTGGSGDEWDNDTHNPNTGGYPDGTMGNNANPNTGDGRTIWATLLLGGLSAVVLVWYGRTHRLTSL